MFVWVFPKGQVSKIPSLIGFVYVGTQRNCLPLRPGRVVLGWDLFAASVCHKP